MEYCRELEFKEEPDYRKCIAFFDDAFKRNDLDKTVLDYTWKQNQTDYEKAKLKKELQKLLKK